MFYERCQTCSKSALTLPRGLDFANLAEAWLRGDEALVVFRLSPWELLMAGESMEVSEILVLNHPF